LQPFDREYFACSNILQQYVNQRVNAYEKENITRTHLGNDSGEGWKTAAAQQIM
jgi:hypothetical protein